MFTSRLRREVKKRGGLKTHRFRNQRRKDLGVKTPNGFLYEVEDISTLLSDCLSNRCDSLDKFFPSIASGSITFPAPNDQFPKIPFRHIIRRFHVEDSSKRPYFLKILEQGSTYFG